MSERRTTAALIVAAGRGTRLGGAVPKQYQLLMGRPLLAWTVEAFAAHPHIDLVQVVIHDDDRALYEAAVQGLAVQPPVSGGASRQESVRRGLDALKTAGVDRVLIHDAARPFVSAALIDRVLDGLASAPGVLPALAVVDSLREVADGRVVGAVSRDGLWRAQTPQGFKFAAIHAAHQATTTDDYTDDVAVLQAAGGLIAVVAGDEENFKVTAADDFTRAERLMLARLGDVRTGNGFDVHRFGPGDQVTLCGVPIPHSHGLMGHSDADVGLHALTDAILGALAMGDIGQAFPPSEPRWKGADSAIFLAHAGDLVHTRGGVIAHVDVTLICEQPKVGPHRDAMRARIAEILRLDISRVSVKATTTEGLGFTGRAEGIAAQASATIRLA